MDTLKGDIWKLAMKAGAYVCVSTNVGWRQDGTNVMGRGIAQQAAIRFPDLPIIYGRWCQDWGERLYVSPSMLVVCIPSKPLNSQSPHLSWKRKSSIKLIRRSYRRLARYASTHASDVFLCPLLGTANGKLPRTVSMDEIDKIEWTDNVYFVERT